MNVFVAQPNHWKRVKRLRLNALSTNPDAFGSTFVKEMMQPSSFWTSRLEDEHAITLLCTLDEVDVGMMVVAPWPELGDQPSLGLFAAFVSPKARKKGVGSALLAGCILEATERGAERLFLDVGDTNQAAVALYKRFGFVSTGEKSTLEPPREHIEEHQMVLDLTTPAPA